MPFVHSMFKHILYRKVYIFSDQTFSPLKLEMINTQIKHVYYYCTP